MKLRWKYFLALLAASLVPLLTVTGISQNTSRRLGKTISEKARHTLTETVKKEMVRATGSYAAFSLLGGMTTEFALKVLAAKAEMTLALPPPPPAKIYFAPDFDDPESAPPDLVPSKNHPLPANDTGELFKQISYAHPSFLLAPGTSRAKAAKDIARLSRLSEALKSLRQNYGDGIVWAYASLESGVHISYPGHGGYPAGYDPRKRPWYASAKTSRTLSWLPVVDATTGQLILSLSMPINQPDGSFAGVAAMDIRMTHALVESETASRWSEKMSTFIMGAETASGSKERRIWAISSKGQENADGSEAADKFSPPGPEIEELFHRIGNRKSGYLDMPYRGVESLWAYSAMLADQYFVIVVPKSEIMTLADEVGQMFEGYSREQRTITGVAALLALLLVGVVAFFTSRFSTSHILSIVDALKRLAKGDFSVRLDPYMNDERVQMVHAFNDIVPKIEEHMRMSTALGLAQEVQQSLLPQGDPSLPGFDIAGASIYCDETGGDYYDFIASTRGGRNGLTVVVGDVSGHGVSSALLMATARALIMLRSSMPGKASEIISEVNRYLSLDTAHTGNFMTFFYCELIEAVKAVRWVRAGHDPALVYDPSRDAFDELDGAGMALGLDKTFQYQSFQRSLESGQVIMIGTDGIWEMRNSEGRMFGKEPLMEVIRSYHTASARRIVKEVTIALDQFRGDQAPEDDTTLVVIKVDR